MRLLVMGAGATGGYFGGRLAAVGRDVTFLLRPARAEAVRRDGLQIVSPKGDLAVKPKIVEADQIDGPYDAVLLTVKAFSLTQALDDLAPAIGSETMILPVLNGMHHVDVLRDRFGTKAVVGCVCKIASILDEQGRIVQLAPGHDLSYGEMDGSVSSRLSDLDGFMQGAGFDAVLAPTIERQMWEKWILLASLGSIGCLMRGTVGEIAAASGGNHFVSSLLDETIAIVRATGTAPSDAFVDTARSLLTAKGSVMTSSMFRDMRRGVRLEADQIVGDLLGRGERAGVSAPLLSAAFTHLRVYEAQRSAG
jgi:2-dehydropantoate 2-reductase